VNCATQKKTFYITHHITHNSLQLTISAQQATTASKQAKQETTQRDDGKV
jgi:hypothetical protein